MKPHHAAALALMGWYLMLPPQTPNAHYDTSAPLAKWHVAAGFDSGDKCTLMAAAAEATALKDNQKEQVERYQAAQCIATNDPRLKPK